MKLEREHEHMLWCHRFAAQTIADWVRRFGMPSCERMAGETDWIDPPQLDAFRTAWGE